MLQRSNTVIEVALQMQHRKYCESLHPIFQYIGIISNPKKSEPCGPLLHFMVESPTKKKVESNLKMHQDGALAC